jgi:large conductance mechanosensitive channel
MIVKDFFNFIREQGVVGLAVGFILGGSITKVVNSMVTDLVNPLLGILLGAFGNLDDYMLQVGGAKILYGNFLSNLINFLVVALVVYVSVKLLRVDRLDRKKDKDAAKK